ncbi:unnamed protein product [Dovyalis caffra]|uniref:Uncharacterized protein n=1 Tax=Dovyalis caffra TaxID=77055 RepID=A0AAV1SLX4_9ROSI|nr:unnamed protein product [Dovyalis caffra]
MKRKRISRKLNAINKRDKADEPATWEKADKINAANYGQINETSQSIMQSRTQRDLRPR